MGRGRKVCELSSAVTRETRIQSLRGDVERARDQGAGNFTCIVRLAAAWAHVEAVFVRTTEGSHSFSRTRSEGNTAGATRVYWSTQTPSISPVCTALIPVFMSTVVHNRIHTRPVRCVFFSCELGQGTAV